MKDKKQALRTEIYNTLINAQISKPNCRGRIPDFRGSYRAADNLRSTNEWIKSKNIFVSPDIAQRKVREYALKDKKLLIMVTPKIQNGYLKLKPSKLAGHEEEASTIEGAFKYGEKIDQLPAIDLVVEGSVAVDKLGRRLGKGGGYGDRELEFLRKSKSINNLTPVVSTVHSLQLVEKVPTEEHDQKINMIVTSKEILRIKNQIDIPGNK